MFLLVRQSDDFIKASGPKRFEDEDGYDVIEGDGIAGCHWDRVNAATYKTAELQAQEDRAQQVRDDKIAALSDAGLKQLLTMRPAEIDTWIDANLDMTAKEKTWAKKLTLAVSVLIRREINE